MIDPYSEPASGPAHTVCVAVRLIDSMTDMPALVLVTPAGDGEGVRVWRAAGYAPAHVLLVDLVSCRVESDPFQWQNGTLWAAHWRIRTEPGFIDAIIAAGDGCAIQCEETRLAAVAQGRVW